MIQITAAAVHQTGNQCCSRRPGFGHGAAEGAGTVVKIDRFVAVIADQAFHSTGDGIKRLFPGDTLEFVLTAFTHTFHRVFQAIRVVHPAAHGTAAQTGTYLMQIFVDIITGIVGFNISDFAVNHMHP